jgi:hypothetical protein
MQAVPAEDADCCHWLNIQRRLCFGGHLSGGNIPQALDGSGNGRYANQRDVRSDSTGLLTSLFPASVGVARINREECADASLVLAPFRVLEC